jgi:hypothetical protein
MDVFKGGNWFLVIRVDNPFDVLKGGKWFLVIRVDNRFHSFRRFPRIRM